MFYLILSLWLLHGHDGQLCSRIALLYLDVLFYCYHLTDLDGLARRVMELGVVNKTFMASYALYFRDMDYTNVVLPGLPASVSYHDDYLEMCHQIIDNVANEVSLKENKFGY